MNFLRISLLAACLVLFGCQSDPISTNDNQTVDNQTSDNQTGTAVAAAFAIKKLMLSLTVDASKYTTADQQVRWDWTNDGTWDTQWSKTKTASYTYPADGKYTVRMEVKDAQGNTDSAVKEFMINTMNQSPKTSLVANVVQGMTVSVDASGCSDAEDSANDLVVRWDWNGDGTWDTDWSTVKTATHTYDNSSDYNLTLCVKDLNDATATASQKITISPITIRSSFFTLSRPYVIRINFRMINNLTGLPVTVSDQPALTRSYFQISEDDTPIDSSETNHLLTAGSRPMHVVLVLDYTGSMYDAGGVSNMVSAAKAFVDTQLGTTELCIWALWERDGGWAEVDDFVTCDAAGKSKLKADIDSFTGQSRDHGASQIWDVLVSIIREKFMPVDDGLSRAVVFLSDGHDTTSRATISDVITAAHGKAVSMFSIGLGFRPQNYPADEPNLKKIADDTNGTYFTINQVADLDKAFSQVAKDLVCDWTLSYVTLLSSGYHHFDVLCNYLNGMGTIKGDPFTIDSNMTGDIRVGLLSVKKGTESATQTEYALCAEYMPRNITTLKIRVVSAAAATLTLYDNETLCSKAAGWTIRPDVAAGEQPPADGRYTLSSISPLEFGAFGKIAKCTVNATGLPAVSFELPALNEQAAMYTDKSIVFQKTGGITVGVATAMTGLTAVAQTGTPPDPSLPSANPNQTITVTGRGFSLGDRLVAMEKDYNGNPYINLLTPTSVAPDGTSMTFKTSLLAVTGQVWLLDDFVGKKFTLQIVPTP